MNNLFQIGDKVTYTYPFNGKKEKGIVKQLCEFSVNYVRVVYHCAQDWDNYENYTSQLTDVTHLSKGWDEDKPAEVASLE